MNPIYKYLIVLVAGVVTGWFINGWRLDSIHNGELATQRSQDLKNYSRQVALYKTSLERSEQSRSFMTSQLQEKENAIQKLAGDVADGRRRLSVRARCPRMPTTEANAGGVEAITAELDPSARPAYFALRSGIERIESLLKFCQSELIERSEPSP